MIVSNASPLIYLVGESNRRGLDCCGSGLISKDETLCILNEMLKAGFYLSSDVMLRFIQSL
jgi:hypothetical protein